MLSLLSQQPVLLPHRSRRVPSRPSSSETLNLNKRLAVLQLHQAYPDHQTLRQLGMAIGQKETASELALSCLTRAIALGEPETPDMALMIGNQSKAIWTMQRNQHNPPSARNKPDTMLYTQAINHLEFAVKSGKKQAYQSLSDLYLHHAANPARALAFSQVLEADMPGSGYDIIENLAGRVSIVSVPSRFGMVSTPVFVPNPRYLELSLTQRTQILTYLTSRLQTSMPNHHRAISELMTRFAEMDSELKDAYLSARPTR